MATPRQIRARIRTAKNIQQITKAMKMVAAARLRRAQEAVGAARPYAQKMREVMASLSAGGSDGLQHPLLRKVDGDPKKIGLILITADRGLAGAYNSSVIKRAVELVRPYGPENVKIVSVGKKGAVFFKRRGFSVIAENPVPQTGISFADAQTLSRAARRLFEEGEIDALYIIYTQFVSAMTQRPQTVQILPLQALDSAATEKAGPKADYIFEPDPEQILGSLLPRYVDTQVFQAVIESVASEHGARMTSMSAATDNAGKMISGLTLTLNRARQAAITKEIAEIVGGAEALK
ncbi:ATP synthase subunit gamma [Capsulimonas corticalis]|uniref:ATP synthase gamma chain n=1 Tax=Capsulimonas corticalis TaxID=2219043 RepID=A0A402CQJ0_9BACT|nr:ATP synthase F1 subunit gamma [Capsulimonas corticalis]BDI32678.1 ATP synthase subunit gamma [Capsulimonas corticalis]